jgi:hypothetical protein
LKEGDRPLQPAKSKSRPNRNEVRENLIMKKLVFIVVKPGRVARKTGSEPQKKHSPASLGKSVQPMDRLSKSREAN